MPLSDDNWIESRMLWAGQKNGLPSCRTFIYKESEKLLPVSLRSAAAGSGVPVYAFVESDDCWTLLGTHAVVTRRLVETAVIPLAAIRSVSWPPELEAANKASCDTVTVVDDNGRQFRIWGPPGREFLALFNLLLRFTSKRNGDDAD